MYLNDFELGLLAVGLMLLGAISSEIGRWVAQKVSK